MSDWITSGAYAPCLATDDTLNGRPKERRKRGVPLSLTIAFFAVVMMLAAYPTLARDDGRYAGTSPELKSWFDSLRSGKGPCCSDADGSAVSDVDWESNQGHYKVRIEGVWFDVPDDAVITVPNKVGRTMVWPIQGSAGTVIRCFLPGSMT